MLTLSYYLLSLTPTNDANVACHSHDISAAHAADSTRNSPNPDQDSKLIMAADRDKNGTIDYEEFPRLDLVVQPPIQSERREFVSFRRRTLVWIGLQAQSSARTRRGWTARRPAHVEM